MVYGGHLPTFPREAPAGREAQSRWNRVLFAILLGLVWLYPTDDGTCQANE